MRNPHDFYPTPEECFTPLEKFIDFSKVNFALEPASGDGRIVYWLREKMKVEFLWGCEIQGNCYFPPSDYFGWKTSFRMGLSITNPPFSQAQHFIEKQLREAFIVVNLLRLDFLGSQSRYSFFEKNPLYALWILSKRPSFTNDGATDQYNYAWFVWVTDPDHKKFILKPGIHHIKNF